MLNTPVFDDQIKQINDATIMKHEAGGSCSSAVHVSDFRSECPWVDVWHVVFLVKGKGASRTLTYSMC